MLQTGKEYKHKNTIELRRLMFENHLSAKMVSEMIHRSHGSVRRYMCEESVITAQLLWILKRKIEDRKAGEKNGL